MQHSSMLTLTALYEDIAKCHRADRAPLPSAVNELPATPYLVQNIHPSAYVSIGEI